MEKKFNEQDSLQLINEMIAQARGNVQNGDGKYSLLWGYIITIASLLHFASFMYSVETGICYSGVIWGVTTLLGLIITAIFAFQDKKKELVRTYTDSITNSLWIGFMGSLLLAGFILTGKYGFLIYPMATLLLTFTLFVNSRAYKMKWMYLYLAICLICTILYKFIPLLYYPLLMAISMIFGTIIPGHIINKKAKEDV